MFTTRAATSPRRKAFVCRRVKSSRKALARARMHAALGGPSSPGSPLAAIGIVSAPPHQHRRNALRGTWLRYPECSSGEVLARFVLAMASDAQDRESINVEAASAGDLLLLGLSSPASFGWLRQVFQNQKNAGLLDFFRFGKRNMLTPQSCSPDSVAPFR